MSLTSVQSPPPLPAAPAELPQKQDSSRFFWSLVRTGMPLCICDMSVVLVIARDHCLRHCLTTLGRVEPDADDVVRWFARDHTSGVLSIRSLSRRRFELGQRTALAQQRKHDVSAGLRHRHDSAGLRPRHEHTDCGARLALLVGMSPSGTVDDALLLGQTAVVGTPDNCVGRQFGCPCGLPTVEEIAVARPAPHRLHRQFTLAGRHQ